MLNFRQTQCYHHRFLVFRGTETVGANGKRVKSGYTQVGGSHPGLYSYTQNDDDPSGVGRVKRRTALTEDKLECEVSVDLKSQDVVVDVSLNADGSHSVNYGQVAKVQGEPRRYPDQGPMQLNYQTVQLMSVPVNEIPDGVAP